VPSIQQYFLDLLEEAKQKEQDPKKVLMMFQTLLEGISEWNVDKVQRETTQIATKSRCDYLEELMTAVFIAHTKVLSAIRLTTKQKKLQITIPKLEHFLHRTLTECARLLWSNTYLFSSSAPTIERQKNLRLIENMLHEGVLQGIRGMLPVKSILREYLKEEDEDEAEEEAEPEPEVKVEVEPEVKVEPKPEVKVEPKSEPQPEVKIEPEAKPTSKPEPKPTSKPEPEPKSESDELNEVELTFTGNDTLSDDLEEEDIPLVTEGEKVEILDEPPAPLDDFEDIESQVLQMDFEELS
jgi:hypothetical protein